MNRTSDRMNCIKPQFVIQNVETRHALSTCAVRI